MSPDITPIRIGETVSNGVQPNDDNTAAPNISETAATAAPYSGPSHIAAKKTGNLSSVIFRDSVMYIVQKVRPKIIAKEASIPLTIIFLSSERIFFFKKYTPFTICCKNCGKNKRSRRKNSGMQTPNRNRKIDFRPTNNSPFRRHSWRTISYSVIMDYITVKYKSQYFYLKL